MSTEGADDTISTTSPDGSTSITQAADPRFGMMAPMTVNGSLTTGSHTLSLGHQRTISLSDPQNPFSLMSLTDTFTHNGATWTAAYDGSTRTMTSTSPTG